RKNDRRVGDLTLKHPGRRSVRAAAEDPARGPTTVEGDERRRRRKLAGLLVQQGGNATRDARRSAPRRRRRSATRPGVPGWASACSWRIGLGDASEKRAF